MLVLFEPKVCSRCEPVSLHLSGFELALYRDALMAPFWGRYGCMSLYLVLMVMFNSISLQPLLAFVNQPLGLKFWFVCILVYDVALAILSTLILAAHSRSSRKMIKVISWEVGFSISRRLPKYLVDSSTL